MRLEANRVVLSTIARVSASSPHFRVSDLLSVLSMDDGLAWVQADPYASRCVAVHFLTIPDHRLDIAATIARNVEGYDALAANRGDHGFVRTNRAQILGHLIRPGRGT